MSACGEVEVWMDAGGGWGLVRGCSGREYEDLTCEALDPLTSKFQKTEPNPQLSSFGCQMVKIAYYNRMKTTVDSVLFP